MKFKINKSKTSVAILKHWLSRLLYFYHNLLIKLCRTCDANDSVSAVIYFPIKMQMRRALQWGCAARAKFTSDSRRSCNQPRMACSIHGNSGSGPPEELWGTSSNNKCNLQRRARITTHFISFLLEMQCRI